MTSLKRWFSHLVILLGVRLFSLDGGLTAKEGGLLRLTLGRA